MHSVYIAVHCEFMWLVAIVTGGDSYPRQSFALPSGQANLVRVAQGDYETVYKKLNKSDITLLTLHLYQIKLHLLLPIRLIFHRNFQNNSLLNIDLHALRALRSAIKVKVSSAKWPWQITHCLAPSYTGHLLDNRNNMQWHLVRQEEIASCGFLKSPMRLQNLHIHFCVAVIDATNGFNLPCEILLQSPMQQMITFYDYENFPCCAVV